jgi:hypothetical protein
MKYLNLFQVPPPKKMRNICGIFQCNFVIYTGAFILKFLKKCYVPTVFIKYFNLFQVLPPKNAQNLRHISV